MYSVNYRWSNNLLTKIFNTKQEMIDFLANPGEGIEIFNVEVCEYKSRIEQVTVQETVETVVDVIKDQEVRYVGDTLYNGPLDFDAIEAL